MRPRKNPTRRHHGQTHVQLALALAAVLPSWAVGDSRSDREVDALIAGSRMPAGVVFEIVGDEQALRWAIPAVQ